MNHFHSFQILGKYMGITWNFDGSWQDKTVYGEKVDIKLIANSVTNDNTGKINLQIEANKQGALIEVESNFNGIEKFAKMKASPTTIELDANIITPITITAQVCVCSATL